jgi:hypothetical protein
MRDTGGSVQAVADVMAEAQRQAAEIELGCLDRCWPPPPGRTPMAAD